MEKPALYIVATPIGNLEDITYRAVRILKEVKTIFCEDTRTTRVLLNRYEIKTPTESFHAHSDEKKYERIVAILESGSSVALVSDAGTPGISDPGTELVSFVRERMGDNVSVVPIPGASALVTALSAAGIPSHEFIFFGFLPHKKGRKTLFEEIRSAERTCVFYESPHRIEKALESLAGSGKKITIARELTKTFEEFVSGTAEEVLASLTQRKVIRGEFVVIVSSFEKKSINEYNDTHE
jgi:16S rRNA (cytidine1402-2'-O)-methyltransferase